MRYALTLLALHLGLYAACGDPPIDERAYRCREHYKLYAPGLCCAPGQILTGTPDGLECSGVPDCPVEARRYGLSCLAPRCPLGAVPAWENGPCCWQGQVGFDGGCFGEPLCPLGTRAAHATCEAWSDWRRVELANGQALDVLRHEVTVLQYQACVLAGACANPGAGDPNDAPFNVGDPLAIELPLRDVRLVDAQRYCTFVGGRVPSAEDVIAVARSGPTPRDYPWGNEPPSCERGWTWNCHDGPRLLRVCSLPSGHSPEGICDLFGNANEWVADGRAIVSAPSGIGEWPWFGSSHGFSMAFRCVRDAPGRAPSGSEH